jgi:hypothetical protein
MPESEIPKSIEIAKSKYNERLNINYKNKGIELYYLSKRNQHHPEKGFPLKLSWAEWEYLVAWVELKRNEEFLKNSLQTE